MRRSFSRVARATLKLLKEHLRHQPPRTLTAPLRAGAGDNLSRRHLHKLISHWFHQRRLVSHDEDCFPLVANPSEHGRHIAGRVCINVGERLIEQHQIRIVQHCPCQREPLTHSLRVLSDAPLEVRIEADLFALRLGKPHRPECRRDLRNTADSPFRSVRHTAAERVPCSRCGVQRLARSLRPTAHPTLARLHQSCDHAQQRALARSVVANDDVETGRERSMSEMPRSAANLPKNLTRSWRTMTGWMAGDSYAGYGFRLTCGRRGASYWPWPPG